MPTPVQTLTHVLTPADHGTRVRIDSTEEDTVDVFVGNTEDVWPVGAYVEVVNISETAEVRLVGVSSETLNLLSGTDTLAYGEYARVSQVVQGTPGEWDVHVYKLSANEVDPHQIAVGTWDGRIISHEYFRIVPDGSSGSRVLHVNTDENAPNLANPVWIQSGGNGYEDQSAKIYMTAASPSIGPNVLPNQPVQTIGPAQLRMYSGDGVDGVDAASIFLFPGISTANSGSVVIESDSPGNANHGLVISHSNVGQRSIFFNANGAIGIGWGVTKHYESSSIASAFSNADYGVPGQLLQSNGKDSRITWQSPSAITPAPLQVLSYNIAFAEINAWHHGKSIRVNEPNDVYFTVEEDAVWPQTDEYWQTNAASSAMPIGGCVMIGKHGPGNVIIVAGNNVTINSPDSLTLSKMHGKVMLMKVGPNEWDVEGNLEAL